MSDRFMTLPEIRRAAKRLLPPGPWGYAAGGAETETTLRRNRQAIRRLALRQRVLVDVRQVDLSTTFLGLELPMPVQRRIAEAVEAADPRADLTLNVACPECGEATRAELDIASYLWTELDAWARDVLLDVHLLATAYGWSEPEILALSPTRRRYYLELCADV